MTPTRLKSWGDTRVLGVSELYGGQNQLFQRLINNIGFGIHVAIPCVVQAFNFEKQIVDVQPTIRERIIQEGGQITYVNYPLLINVPVVFQQAGDYSMTFPIKKDDECLVIFSDLSIDNWWESGNVQNPVEQRRHDLSDGMAIFGLKNQKKLSRETKKPPANKLCLFNKVNGVAVGIGETDGYISAMSNGVLKTVNFSQIIDKVNE